MVAINQEELVGSLMPNVYISKITLENTGYPATESNPHIDHAREKKVSGDSSFSATVDLIVKEKLGNDLVGNWFANNDITKYLNLYIYQVTDPILTTYLGYGKDSFGLLSPFGLYAAGDAKYELASLMYGASRPNETVTTEKIDIWLSRSSRHQKVPLSKENDGNDSRISQFKSRVDDDGNVVYDISYRVNFRIGDSSPAHIAFFAFCQLDAEKISSDFDIPANQFSFSQTIGNVASDIAINDGAVVSKSFIFFDPEQKVWAGPVHRSETTRGWFSGATPGPNAIPLTRRTVANAKIQDFRNAKEIEKLMIDFSKVENNVLSVNPLKRLSNDNIVSTYKNTYFSEMSLTRNADGDAKFVFSVDLKKALLEQTRFGGLLAGKEELCRQALISSKINSIKVYRQRVKEDFSLTLSGTPSGLKPFDKNEPLELIASSGEKTWKNFTTVNTARGSLREQEVVLEDPSYNGIRFFTGMDKTMSEITDGIYRYVVKLDIDDGTVEFIKGRIRSLLSVKTQLEGYLAEGSQQSLSRYIAESKDPHTDNSVQSSRSDSKIAGNYDPVSNRFTDYFTLTMYSRYSAGDPNAPWNNASLVYANNLKLITGKEEMLNRIGLVDILHNFLSPATGNPTSIGMVIKLVDKLADTLATLIGASTSSLRFGEGSQQPASSGVSTQPKRTFELSKSFNAIFDSDVTKGFGADYLSGASSVPESSDGLRVVGSGEYEDRVQLELERYFREREPNVNIDGVTSDDSYENTSFTFLTPLIIYTEEEEYNLDDKFVVDTDILQN